MKIYEHGKAYDLIVCGAGPAGVAAAIAAGRAGLRTLVIERAGYPGGVSTAGALPFWLGGFTGSKPYKQMLREGTAYADLPRPRRAVGGIFKELCDTLRDMGAGVGAGPCMMAQSAEHPGLGRLGCHDEFTFDLEAGKRVLEQAMLNAGAELLYYSSLCGAEMSGGEIRCIYVANQSGVTRYTAGAYIDCTGDAVLASFAGVPTYAADVAGGNAASVSLVAHIEGVDSGMMAAYLDAGGDPFFRAACDKARAAHPGLDLPDHLLIFPMVQPGVFMVNAGTFFSGYDALDPADLTRLSVRGRARAALLAEIVFKYVPGGENSSLRLTAPWPGVRETRRIVSEGALTEEDLLAGRAVPDSVALAARHFDLERGASQPFHEKGLSMKRDAAQIPYSCMVPQGCGNLLAAGRCVQADGQALGPARIMATCFAMGQAAGEAAALKLAAAQAFRDVDYAALRARLLAHGAILD